MREELFYDYRGVLLVGTRSGMIRMEDMEIRIMSVIERTLWSGIMVGISGGKSATVKISIDSCIWPHPVYLCTFTTSSALMSTELVESLENLLLGNVVYSNKKGG